MNFRVHRTGIAAGLSTRLLRNLFRLRGQKAGRVLFEPLGTAAAAKVVGSTFVFLLARGFQIPGFLKDNAQVHISLLGVGADADRAFYDGKLASARFFAKNVLPGIGLARQLIEAGDLELMALSDDSF